MTGRPRPWRLLGLCLAIAVVVIAAYASGATHYLSVSELAHRHQDLRAAVQAHPGLSLLIYAGAYFAAILLFLPVMTVMLVAGGLLFGVASGAGVALATGLLGAVAMFLAARTALGARLRTCIPPGGVIERMETGLRRHAFSYLLTSRLIPIFPFGVVNVVAGSVQMPLRAFAAATLLGLIPPALVYTSLGAGLETVLARGQRADLAMMTSPGVVGPLIALATLSTTPHLYRVWRRIRRSSAGLEPRS